jgi:hypothetical protein
LEILLFVRHPATCGGWTLERWSNSALEEIEEGENLARTIPTSNPDPDQEQGGLGVWCVASGGKERKRSRALGPVRPTSDAAPPSELIK